MNHQTKDPFCLEKGEPESDILANSNFLLPLSKQGYDILKHIWKTAVNESEEHNNSNSNSSGSHERESRVNKTILKASPFCHESFSHKVHHSSELRGWVLDVPCESPASSLPVPINLFHGVSVALCEASEDEILTLMQNVDDTKTRLAKAIEEIMDKSTAPGSDRKTASWSRCRPSLYGGHPPSLMHAVRDKRDGTIQFCSEEGCCPSTSVVMGEEGGGASTNTTPVIDSEGWIPELSPDGFVGFYHRWQNTSQGNKLLLYCVCQSYLPKACREFADMVYKLGGVCSAGCVCLSEEAQWLRSVCSRNRARIIARVSRHMGIKVPVIRDYNASSSWSKGEEEEIAIVTNETLHHDMNVVAVNATAKKNNIDGHYSYNVVRVLNYCCETRSAFNGVTCVMAPWEGLWIFEGLNPIQDFALKPMSGVSDFGKPYGNFVLCTSAPRVSFKTISSRQHKRGLTYSCGNSLSCKSHELWSDKCSSKGDSDDNGTSSTTFMYHTKNPMESGGLMIPVDGLDDVVVEAYKEYLSKQQRQGNHPSSYHQSEERKDKEYYLTFDEHVMSAMSKFGWSRTQGIIKFMPLACGMYEHWDMMKAGKE